jgi:hypothetical protein
MRTFTILGSATAAVAAESTSGSGTSPLVILFLAFFALVVASQLIPGVILFVAALKGVFGKRVAHPEAETDKPS